MRPVSDRRTDLEDDMPDPAPTARDSLWMRLVWMLLLGTLMSLVQSIVFTLSVVQLILMAFNKASPNAEIAGFGQRLGLWQARATRYMTVASDDKPWPWSPLD